MSRKKIVGEVAKELLDLPKYHALQLILTYRFRE